MFEVQWARDLKDTRDLGFLSEGQAGYESWADVVGVDEVGANVVDELAAGAQGGGNAPRFLRGEIEVGAEDGGSGLAIFGGEAFGVGGERDDYFDTERTEDTDLFVGPICADGGLHDVQDLHGGDHSNPKFGWTRRDRYILCRAKCCNYFRRSHRPDGRICRGSVGRRCGRYRAVREANTYRFSKGAGRRRRRFLLLDWRW